MLNNADIHISVNLCTPEDAWNRYTWNTSCVVDKGFIIGIRLKCHPHLMYQYFVSFGYQFLTNFKPMGNVFVVLWKMKLVWRKLLASVLLTSRIYSIDKLNTFSIPKYVYYIYRSLHAPREPSLFDPLSLKPKRPFFISASELTIVGDYNVHTDEWVTYSARIDDSGL